MRPVDNRILVKVNMSQKDKFKIGDIEMTAALLFENNYRERSPVIAEVINGNEIMPNNSIIICHHNHFYSPSPYFISDNLFSIPFNKTIFGILNEDGEINPMCGNIICQRLPVEYAMPVPVEEQKTHIDRALVINPGDEPYQPRQLIFHRLHAGYDIVYNWFGEERRRTKVHADMIVGFADNCG